MNTCCRLNFYSQQLLAVKITTLYRFQKSINKRNTKVNGDLSKFTYFCAHYCPRSFSHQQHRQHFNNRVSQSKLFDTIVRHSIKISEDHLTLKALT